MCFHIHPEHKEEKTAIEDIVCYKHSDKRIRNFLFRKIFISDFQKFRYRFNKLYKLDKKIVVRYSMVRCGCQYDKTGAIHEGFHSYAKLPEFPPRLVKCIIPKGSQYYYNPFGSGEYVSNQIIIKNKMKSHW